MKKANSSDRTLRITGISIKNFRSIRSLSITTESFTVISGLNDVGKSNILKALNLFFNGQTDAGKELDFDQDYCLSTPVQKKKAKIIEIALTFRIPDNFKDKGEVVWTKCWYRNGRTEDRKSINLSPRSKAGMLFQRIKYRYVPAIKSESYFKTLLTDLYSSLAKDVDGELAKKTGEYSETIKKYTSRISKVVNSQFHVQSNLEYPQDQSAIFKELQFITSNAQGERVSLSHRGDGVQTAHIPAILQFIADKDNEGLGANSILCSTFWGYEEPENGLEMLRCYGMAEELFKVSSRIQMLVTSHSPAFFTMGKSDGAKAYWVEQDESGATVVRDGGNGVESLGYMPMIAPYIEKHRKELELRNLEIAKLRKVMEQTIDLEIDTIMVEGVTDRDYLQKAISIHSPRLHELLRMEKLRFYCRSNDGGTSNLVGYAQVWDKAKIKKKLVIVLDSDSAGKKAASSINELHNPNIKIALVPLAPWMKRIYDVIVEQQELGVSIETLLPPEVWGALSESNLLEPRQTQSLVRMFAKIAGRDKTIDEAIAQTLQIEDRIYVNYEARPGKKGSIVQRVFDLAKNNVNIFAEFKTLVSKIEHEIMS